MSLRKKLRDIFFAGAQRDAEKRVRQLIRQQCDWNAIEPDVFPAKGIGVNISVVLGAIIEHRNWKLLTPLLERCEGYLDIIDLVYRKGETGPTPPGRALEHEQAYQALLKAPRHGRKAAAAFVSLAASQACAANSEECYDWARAKPEFTQVEPVGLVALADRPIVGNRLAMKVLHSAAEIDRAADAVDWFYGHSPQGDEALANLDAWRKKLEEQNRKPPPPPGPVF